jgi:O-Antigen ligase
MSRPIIDRVPTWFFPDGRLDLWWNNPNYTAAAIVAILPIIWMAQEPNPWRNRSSIRYFMLVVETVLTAGLGWTGSRGAFVGFLVALGLLITGNKEKQSTQRFLSISRVAMVSIGLIIGNQSHRILNSASNDLSVIHRLTVWKECLGMIAASPLLGWGRGSSGAEYMQWFQSPSVVIIYHGLVNTYLHIAVEFGLLVFVSYLFAVISIIVICLGSSSKQIPANSMAKGCGLGLAAFTTASIFSTLWLIRSLILIEIGLAIIGLYFAPKIATKTLKRIFVSGAICCLLAFGLYLGGTMQLRSWRIRLLKTGVIELASSRAEKKPEAVMILDRSTLGPLYGKEIRSVLDGEPTWDKITVIEPGTAVTKADIPASSKIYVFGASIARVSELLDDSRQVILVCPNVSVAECRHLVSIKAIILPGIDEFGFSKEWNSYAIKLGASVYHMTDEGQDIRLNWKTTFSHLEAESQVQPKPKAAVFAIPRHEKDHVANFSESVRE